MLLRMKGKRSLLGITLELFQAHSIVTLSFIFKVLFYAFSFVIFLDLTTAIHKPYWFIQIYSTPSNNLHLNLLIKTIFHDLSIKGFFFNHWTLLSSCLSSTIRQEKKKKSLISLKLLLSNAGESYTSMNTYITTNSWSSKSSLTSAQLLFHQEKPISNIPR